MKDPHNYRRRLESTIQSIKESKAISRKDKATILKFDDQCLLNISIGRTVRYMQSMRKLAEWMKVDLEDATKDDIKTVVAEINKMDYSPWTKQMYRVVLRKFYQWVRGFEWNSKKYPEEVEWIRTTVSNNNKKLPEEMLTEEEIKKLINVAEHPRNRAFVSVLYESGCRIGELLMLKIKHVEFDGHGARLHVSGKTGSRVVRIVASVPYLQEWINKHPMKNDKESPLWVRRDKNEEIGYGGVQSILKKLGRRAGITKPLNPHNFRHSRATHLANDLTEAQLCEFFGWTQGSDQASTYVHLSGRDIDKAILKTYGIEEGEQKKEKNVLKPIKCPRCEEVNEATNKFCRRCGRVIDEEAETELIRKDTGRDVADKIFDKLIQDDKRRERFIGLIKEVIGEMG